LFRHPANCKRAFRWRIQDRRDRKLQLGTPLCQDWNSAEGFKLKKNSENEKQNVL
jgi:hypothetical protein